MPGVRASERDRTAALPVEQRAVDVQVLHGHLNAPVGVAGGRHGAGSSAAQVSQVGELVVRDGGMVGDKVCEQVVLKNNVKGTGLEAVRESISAKGAGSPTPRT